MLKSWTTEDAAEKAKGLAKAAAFAAWLALVLGVGWKTSADPESFARGAGYLLVALAVPAATIAAARRLHGLAAWARRLARRGTADDDAVSPVVGVILMVAITVVLAAVVFVWVGGMGGQQPTMPGTLALTLAQHEGANWTYVVTSSMGLDWNDLRILTPTELPYGNSAGEWCAGRGGGCLVLEDAGPVRAGDALVVRGAPAGTTLRVIDAPANQQVLQTTMG